MHRHILATAGLLVVAGLTTAALADGPFVTDWRSIDGSGNNANHPTWGDTHGGLLRLSPADYDDGMYTPVSDRPNARAVSNRLMDQPIGASTPDARGLSQYAWVWGQFLDHDLSLTPPQSGAERIDIAIPIGDPVFQPGSAIPMDRSVYMHQGTPGDPREHMNMLTSWLDGSQVYGGRGDEGTARTDWLRSGVGGRMRTSTINGQTFLPTYDQAPGAPYMEGGPRGIDPSVQFVAGDVRANEHTALSSMHTIMVREHNRVADRLFQLDPTASDDELFEAARKVVGASVQAITYNQYLPALGIDVGSYEGYDATVKPTVSTEFSTAGFRLHSMIANGAPRLNADGSTHAAGDLGLLDGFWNPTQLTSVGIEPLLRGLAASNAEANDVQVVDALRNVLFGTPGGGPVANGTDIAAIDIQRGRDHGVADLNTVREALGLEAYESFAEISDDPAVVAALESAYAGDLSCLDLWPGLLAETPLVGGSLGETMTAIIAEQFGRTRDGDRFFYLNDADFAPGSPLAKAGFDAAYFANLGLGDLIALNTDIDSPLGLGGNIFFAAPVPEPTTVGLLAIAAGGLLLRRRR